MHRILLLWFSLKNTCAVFAVLYAGQAISNKISAYTFVINKYSYIFLTKWHVAMYSLQIDTLSIYGKYGRSFTYLLASA